MKGSSCLDPLEGLSESDDDIRHYAYRHPGIDRGVRLVVETRNVVSPNRGPNMVKAQSWF
jgi:hypothetical protein